MEKLLNNTYTKIAVLVIYIILLYLGIANHEMWMDESHHWLIARESANLSELLHNYRYDGHPILWVLIMHIYSYFSDHFFGVQVIHALIALTSILILMFKAPFPSLFKYAFVLSYFPLYEYGVIARNYSLLMLLLFCFVIVRHKNRPLLGWIILGLIANAHLFGLLFSGLYGVYWFYKNEFSEKPFKISSQNLLSYFCFSILVLFSVISILPPQDHPALELTGASFSFSQFADSIMLLFKSLFPIPDFTSNYSWNLNYLTRTFRWAIAPIAVLSWLLPFLFKWNNKWYVAIWYCISGFIALFIFMTDLIPGIRYGGIPLLFLLSLKWADYYEGNESNSVLNIFESKTKLFILAVIMCAQLFSSIFSVVVDLKKPFSSTKYIQEYLVEKNYDKIPLVSNAFCNSISIRNYTDNSIYFLNIKQDLRYCDWRYLDDAAGLDNQLNLRESIQEARAFMMKNNLESTILLYHGEDIFDHSDNSLNVSDVIGGVDHLFTFKKGIVKRENYALYRVMR